MSYIYIYIYIYDISSLRVKSSSSQGIGISVDLSEESVGALRHLTVILHKGLYLRPSFIPEKRRRHSKRRQ